MIKFDTDNLFRDLWIIPPPIIIPKLKPPFCFKESLNSTSLVIPSKITSAVVSAAVPIDFETAVLNRYGFFDKMLDTALPNGPDTYAPKPPYSIPFLNFSLISFIFCSVKPSSLVAALSVVRVAGMAPIVSVIFDFKLDTAAFFPYCSAVF